MHSHEHARQRFRFLMGIFDKSARERDGRDASGANTKLVSFLFSFWKRQVIENKKRYRKLIRYTHHSNVSGWFLSATVEYKTWDLFINFGTRYYKENKNNKEDE